MSATWAQTRFMCPVNSLPNARPSLAHLQSSPVTCLTWPRGREDVVFGLSDGKVKLGMLKTNKPYTMYTHPDNSYVVSLASSPNGQAVVRWVDTGRASRCSEWTR